MFQGLQEVMNRSIILKSFGLGIGNIVIAMKHDQGLGSLVSKVRSLCTWPAISLSLHHTGIGYPTAPHSCLSPISSRFKLDIQHFWYPMRASHCYQQVYSILSACTVVATITWRVHNTLGPGKLT